MAAEHRQEAVAMTRCLVKQDVPCRVACKVRQVVVTRNTAFVPASLAKWWDVSQDDDVLEPLKGHR
jgi:hypothetical protein